MGYFATIKLPCGVSRRLGLAHGVLLIAVILACVRERPVAADVEHTQERLEMVEVVSALFRQSSAATGLDSLDPEIRAALERVPRHLFVPSSLADAAYADTAIPIGHGQTISQPFIVALMTQLAAVDGDSVVLEVGTGSGYQAAVLAELVKRVYSIEIVTELAEEAALRLTRLGYDNVETRAGDGYGGWPEAAPFDAILVTAAAPEIPLPLIEQLAPGGRLIAPVGAPHETQELMLLEKRESGVIETRTKLPVAFVPLTRE
jgi:protein-L-isoaspartate(D-aspartate) O-methyltransferase